MTKLIIEVDRREYCTRDPDAGDEWDAGDSAADIRVVAASIANRYYDIKTEQDIQPGDKVYVVWVNYDTGSTFGRACNQFYLCDVFTDPREAEFLRHEILVNSKKANKFGGPNERRDLHISYYNNEKAKELYTGTWKGYFESFNYADITEVMVRNEDKSSS